MFGFCKKNAILDVNSERVCLTVLDGRASNNFAYQKEKKYSGYQEGIFYDLEEFKQLIRSFIYEYQSINKNGIKHLLISVPGDFSTIKIKTIENSMGKEPRVITDKDLDTLSEIGNTFGTNRKYKCINSTPIAFNTDTKYNIYSPLGLISSQISADIAYVLAERSYIEIFEEVGREFNIKVEFTSTVVNQAIFILTEEQRDKGAFLLDFDYLNCVLAYVKGDGVISSKSLPLGYGVIIGAISTVLDIPYEHCVELYKSVNLFIEAKDEDNYTIVIGGETFEYSINTINEIVATVLVEISKEILEERNRLNDQNSILYILGKGISRLNGAKETLTTITESECEFIIGEHLNFKFPEDSGKYSLWQVANRLRGESLIKRTIKRLQEGVFNNGKQRSTK